MKQAQVIKPGEIRFAEVENPTSKPLADDEILLKIHRIGVCGSDIHVIHGQHPFVTYPVIQGHEYGASVVAVGKMVTKVKTGDKATARPQLVCGTCPPCRKGRYNVCQNLRVQGFQAPGAAQSHFVVTEDRIIKVDDALSYDEIAMIEPCAVAAHATSKTDLQGKNVVVTGAGTIGNLVAQFAQARGAKKVLITDVGDLRLEKAKTCGIQYTANTLKEKFEDAVQRVFGDELFQTAFEVSAAQQCLTDLVANIEKGNDIVIVGVFSQPALVNLAVVDEHEITLIGSMMYKHEDFELAGELLRDGKINVKPLVTQHFDFEDYAEAYRFIDNHREECMKVVIKV
ncbi:MAG: threonine 3-dehydrogenase [Candidatus Ordinivivax streblomastigis]|uniref:Threonine 3-dehydrogenase n=1 Tax=Candidatus Ordinivivax streblomastigis TaxID=2540710 RepID=A0A5M8NV76_9BACT|nr:MAG: threonine 3-dehydrogenase [Candidatus Ordinivivax streblomastigis]